MVGRHAAEGTRKMRNREETPRLKAKVNFTALANGFPYLRGIHPFSSPEEFKVYFLSPLHPPPPLRAPLGKMDCRQCWY